MFWCDLLYILPCKTKLAIYTLLVKILDPLFLIMCQMHLILKILVILIIQEI